MAADKTATFGIKIDADTNADLAAESVLQLQKRITASQEAIKGFSAAQRGLRGSSDEVTAAREKLKAAVTAERDAVSRATLALGQQGTTYDAVSKKVRENAKAADAATKEQEKLAAANAKAGGPLKDASSKLSEFAEKLTTTKGLMTLAAGASLLLAAGIVKVASSLGGVGVSLASFILEQGNALRTMGLFREAATGSESNAKAFGNQIDALGRKIPTTREELNKLAVEQSRLLVGTRISGQGIVDTFNAVAQTSAAMGDSAGKAIQGIIERGKTFGRVGIGLYELQGTGIDTRDVASQLAKNLKIGILDAQLALRSGRVKIDDAAKALRDVVETRFGPVNAKRMIDFDIIVAKLKDKFQNLTKGVDLEPVLKTFEKLANLFDTSTVTGTALKGLITDFGTGIGRAFERGFPLMQDFFEKGVIYALKFEIAWLKINIQLDRIFGKDSVANAGMALFSTVMGGIQLQFDAILGAAKLLEGILTKIGALNFPNISKGLGLSIGADSKEIAAGVAGGISGASGEVEKATRGLAEGSKDSFKGAMGIHSPSTVFAEYGAQTAEGYAGGVRGATGIGQAAVQSLVPSAPVVPNIGGGGGGHSVIANVIVNFPNVKDGKEAAAAMSGPAFKAQLLKALEEVAIGQGIPVQ